MSNIFVPNLEPGKIHRTEFTVKRSRFITSIGHTKGQDQVTLFLNNIRSEFSDARHNCFAFNAGKGNSTAQIGCSDDGEPKGTAGQPMLNVLTHSGFGEICVVVTRYFGGILLGTGGLVKAYQDGIKTALETLPSRIFEETEELSFLITPSLTNLIINICKKEKLYLSDPQYSGNNVMFKVSVPTPKLNQIKSLIIDASRGKVVFID